MKITITIEDTPDGEVFIASDPPLGAVFTRVHDGKVEQVTPAEGYAMAAWAAIVEQAGIAASEHGASVDMWTDTKSH